MSSAAPVESRPAGFLLKDLEYLSEPDAAAAIDVKPKTMVEYRKAGIGPDFIIVARKVLYSRDALTKWLAAGGSKEALASAEKPRRPAADTRERARTRSIKRAPALTR